MSPAAPPSPALAAVAAAVLALSASAGAETSPEVDFAAAVVAFAEGDYEVAVEGFREVLEARPEHRGAGHYLGRALLALERYEEAVDALAQAASAHPADRAIRLDLGLAFLQMGNQAFAARTLAQVVRAEPESARARFLLGVALFRQGDCDLAVEHLAEARRLDASLGPRARYLSGLCAVRGEDFDRAREELGPVARSPLDEPLADAAQRFIDLSLRAEGTETRVFTGSAGLSFQFDSNPTVAPGTLEPFPSFGLVLQAEGTLRAVATEGHTLAGRVGFYRSFYFPAPEAADYDLTFLTGSALYQLRGEGGGARHQLQLGYEFSLSLFDGEPPQPPVDDRHIYNELHGGRVVWSVRQTEELLMRLTLLVRHRTFAWSRRNNLGVTAGLGQAVAFRGDGVQLYVEVTARAEEAGTEYDLFAPGALVSVSWRAPWDLLLTGWVLYEHEIYPIRRWGGSDDEERRDHAVTVSLSLERPIVRHLALSLDWRHWENISTVESFTYRRDVVSLNVTGRL